MDATTKKTTATTLSGNNDDGEATDTIEASSSGSAALVVKEVDTNNTGSKKDVVQSGDTSDTAISCLEEDVDALPAVDPSDPVDQATAGAAALVVVEAADTDTPTEQTSVQEVEPTTPQASLVKGNPDQELQDSTAADILDDLLSDSNSIDKQEEERAGAVLAPVVVTTAIDDTFRSDIFRVETPPPSPLDSTEGPGDDLSVHDTGAISRQASTDSSVSKPDGWAKAQAEDCSQPWVYRMNFSQSMESKESKDDDSKKPVAVGEIIQDSDTDYSEALLSVAVLTGPMEIPPPSLEDIAEGSESQSVRSSSTADNVDPDYTATCSLLPEHDLDTTHDETDEDHSEEEEATAAAPTLSTNDIAKDAQIQQLNSDGDFLDEKASALECGDRTIGTALKDKPTPAAPFWRRRKIQYALLGGLLVIIGVAVGVTVGTSGSDETPMPSMSPSSAPSTFELDRFEPLLPDYSKSSILDEDSPQARAIEWLDSDPDSGAYTNFQRLQRFALATLYFATNGKEWVNNGGWVEGFRFDECDWYTGDSDSLESCADGRFEAITLDLNSLVGTLPDELAILTDLKVLDMGFNRLSGPIPSRLGLLTNLQSLSLYINSLEGKLPAELSGLSLLLDVDLSRNALTGPIPGDVFVGWRNVKTAALSGNSFEGVLPPELGRMRNVEYLDLSNNSFEGEIPTEIGLLGSLQTLYLHQNRFSGTIPSTIGLLSQLRRLTLGTTDVSGSVPSEVCSLQQSNVLVIEVDCSRVQCDCDCTCV